MEVRTSRELLPCEQEVHISTTAEQVSNEGTINVYACHRSWIKYVLALSETDNRVQVVGTHTETIDGEECITSVRAVIPIGYLTLKSIPRTNEDLSQVVSSPKLTAVSW